MRVELATAVCVLRSPRASLRQEATGAARVGLSHHALAPRTRWPRRGCPVVRRHWGVFLMEVLIEEPAVGPAVMRLSPPPRLSTRARDRDAGRRPALGAAHRRQ